jgi:hypothetical protein
MRAVAAILTIGTVWSVLSAQPAKAQSQVAVTYVESSRKWKYGMNSRPYDKISKDIQGLLIQKLAAKGWTSVDTLTGSCCKVVIEVVEVSEHMAAFGKPGIDMVVTFGVRDAGGRQVYSKTCRGESRALGPHTWGGLVDIAAKNLVDEALKEDDLIKALAGPRDETASR